MGFLKKLGSALGAPLRAAGLGKVAGASMKALPGGNKLAQGMGLGKQSPIGPSPKMMNQMPMQKQPMPPIPNMGQAPAPPSYSNPEEMRTQGNAMGQDMSWMNQPGAISPEYGGGAAPQVMPGEMGGPQIPPSPMGGSITGQVGQMGPQPGKLQQMMAMAGAKRAQQPTRKMQRMM